MKKLMFAAAAIAAGVAMADVTSANVVGYQGLDIVNGNYNYFVSTFDKVDGSAMKLGDIGVDENYVSSVLSFLETNGSTKKFDLPEVGLVEGMFIYYFEADLVGTDFEGQPGWYYDLGTMINVNSLDVPFGSLFYLEGMEEAKIVASGAVADEEQPIDIVNGLYNYTGNCSPVNLTLGDITVDENYVSSVLSFLETNGSTKKFDLPEVGLVEGMFIYYFEADLIGTDFEGQPGWYYDLGTMINVNNIPLPAGSTFYLEGMEDCQVFIPPAITKAAK